MNPWKGLKGLPREAWVLCVSTLVNRSGTMVLPFLVLFLTQNRGLSPARASLALSVYGLGGLFVGPLAGRVADRLGALRIMQWSLLLSGGLLLIYPALSHFGAILGLTLVLAAVTEAFRPANLSLLSQVVEPEQRKAVFALNRLAVNLGMSVGPAVGGLLAGFSFLLVFWVDGATSLLAALILVFGFRAGRGERAGRPAARGGAEEGKPAWRDAALWGFVAALLPALLVFFQLNSTLPLFLVRELGQKASAFGFLLSLNTLLIVFLEVPLNLAISHWPHRRTMVLGILLTGLGFGGYALARGFWSAVPGTVVWTFGEMLLFPGTAAFVADLSPESRRGEYMGLYTMTFATAFTVGPFAGTLLYSSRGALALWGASAGMALASALLMARVKRPAKERREPAGTGPESG
jgi:predicted MFS family arabinose efflux permease